MSLTCSPAPIAELNHSCTGQCPVSCDAARSLLPLVPLAASCGNPDNCAYPNCACPFISFA